MPLRVSVNAPPPAAALVGLMEVSVGAGLLALALNDRWKLVVPPSPRTDELMKK